MQPLNDGQSYFYQQTDMPIPTPLRKKAKDEQCTGPGTIAVFKQTDSNPDELVFKFCVNHQIHAPFDAILKSSDKRLKDTDIIVPTCSPP